MNRRSVLAVMLALGLVTTVGIGHAAARAVAGLPDFTGLVKQLTPVTVYISSTRSVKTGPMFQSPFGPPDGSMPGDPFEEFYRRFFGPPGGGREYKQQSGGSGFIIDAEGYVLTNNHVVADADEVTVQVHDGTEYEAEIVGTDPKTDVALLELKEVKGQLAVARLGDSEALQVGEWVLAVGNPFGLSETVTAGIVSAKFRKTGSLPYENFIQTDASINPGNSGGPLFNLAGEVVGVNSMIYSPSGGNVGIGFAIPINLAREVVEQLKSGGKVVRGWLGVVVQEVTPELAQSFDLESGRGALVADVAPDGPADAAGIQAGDIIMSFDGRPVKAMNELPLMVARTPIDKKVLVTVLRDGKTLERTVVVGELQDEDAAQAEPQAKATQLGLRVQEITPELAARYNLAEQSGVIIVGVAPGSPAGEAGLRRGDIIRQVNRERITSLKSYRAAVARAGSANILMLVKREGMQLFVVIKQD